MNEPDRAPDRLQELPPDTRKFLAGLRPEELDTLRAVVGIPAEDLPEIVKWVHDMRTVGRFTRWTVLTVVSIFISTVVLYEYVLKALGHLRGGPGQ